jgi:hypothetical protein
MTIAFSSCTYFSNTSSCLQAIYQQTSIGHLCKKKAALFKKQSSTFRHYLFKKLPRGCQWRSANAFESSEA